MLETAVLNAQLYAINTNCDAHHIGIDAILRDQEVFLEIDFDDDDFSTMNITGFTKERTPRALRQHFVEDGEIRHVPTEKVINVLSDMIMDCATCKRA